MRGVFPHLEPGVPADLQTNLSYHCITQTLHFYEIITIHQGTLQK